MSRGKGNRTIREKAKPFYEGFGFVVGKTEAVSRFAKVQDLFSDIFDEDAEEYRDTGFDLLALRPDKVIFVQVTTNNPKTQKFYKEFARRYGSDVVKVHVFTHYDRDGFRIQDYQPDGTIKEIELRKSKNNETSRSFWWWKGKKEIRF